MFMQKLQQSKQKQAECNQQKKFISQLSKQGVQQKQMSSFKAHSFIKNHGYSRSIHSITKTIKQRTDEFRAKEANFLKQDVIKICDCNQKKYFILNSCSSRCS